MKYYAVVALASTLCILPITAIVLLPSWFKYRTLRYRFDDEGISMAWGMLFRREINLTYRRIQDIHVTRNLFQRWMGLAKVPIQTASGSTGATMTIEECATRKHSVIFCTLTCGALGPKHRWQRIARTTTR